MTQQDSTPIVVGVLAPDHEDAMLSYAADLAVAERRPLRLIHATPDNTVFGNSGRALPQSILIDYNVVDRAAEDLVQQAVRQARCLVDGAVEVTGEVAHGHAARTLVDASETAYRVIVQRRNQSPVQRIFTGSISSRIAAHASCPVIVVPEDWIPEGRSGVVVGVTDTQSDDTLVNHAVSAGVRLGKESVTVLHSLELLRLYGGMIDGTATVDWTARARRYVTGLIEESRQSHPENIAVDVDGAVVAQPPPTRW